MNDIDEYKDVFFYFIFAIWQNLSLFTLDECNNDWLNRVDDLLREDNDDWEKNGDVENLIAMYSYCCVMGQAELVGVDPIMELLPLDRWPKIYKDFKENHDKMYKLRWCVNEHKN